MNIKKLLVSSTAALALMGTSACVTDPNTGEKKVSRTAIGGVGGAALGYLLGGVIGGKTARIVGAAAGGAIGGYVGYRMDEQIREIDEATEGSGIDVSQTPDGEAILVNLPDLTFATDSTEISPGLRAGLDEVAASLVKYPNSLIDVMGHTDSVGREDYNLGLSKRRAEAVASYLEMRGVARSRVQTIGYGEQYPIASNDTADGRAQNRRVEIKITPLTQAEIDAAM
ncbi:OmpA family protein [Paraurantiacibacter namhicola]|uniref:Putative lipoprotein YiaD n=1 Tax=Paraurantiacibacter namhicola TaxID=645517 RepID=A0A1C7D5B9_9SPHN|nr:OmpA family protein [Paraurantiacibacter namhicola]ANU06676.1 putative lipoprotein YiaD precursor [Paraurantiacibacter namhicola]